MAVWAGDLFLNHYVKLFAKIKIFKFEEDFDFKFGAFHSVNIHFVVQIRIVHFLFTDSVVKVFFPCVIKCLVSLEINRVVPTVICSNLCLD